MTFRQFFRFQHSNRTLAMACSEEILSEIQKIKGRIKVITCEKECKRITDELLKTKAISIDLEAVQKSPGLVQIADYSKNIFLFRTGINTNLFTKGGLKNLLECPKVTKVLHAAVMDCSSLHKAGIYVDPLFDTNIAHAVIQFQNYGQPYTSSIGLNNLCKAYNLPTNPLKETHKGYFWVNMEPKFYKKDTLPEDLILYSAYDVVPMLDLYEILRRLIHPDFKPLFHELMDDMLIRNIDEKLVSVRQKERKAQMKRQLFLNNISVKKGYIYKKLLPYHGQKKVQMAENSAVVTLDNREDVLQFYQEMLKAGEYFVKLVKDEKSETNLNDCDMFAQIIEKLINFDITVALLFVNTAKGSTIELVFNDKSVKFDLGGIHINHIGSLMQSGIVKIIPRLNLKPVQDAIILMSTQGYDLNNVFDIDSAARICDHYYHNKPILTSSSQSLNSLCQKYEIPLSTKKKEIFDLHTHLSDIMPEERSNFQELMELHISSALGDKAKTKIAKNAFKLLYDTKNEESGNIMICEAEKADKTWLQNASKMYEEKLKTSGIHDLINKINST